MTVQDTLSEDGEWLLEICRVRTVSGRLWKNIQIRTKVGGAEQRRRPHYLGCVNGFESFQSFVEWHREQKAYGLGWELDKDLLSNGTKLYHPSTCVLLPKQINSLLTNRSNYRGVYPIGVKLDKRSGKFGAACSRGDGISVWLGTYSTPDEAFQNYKQYKEKLCKKLAEDYKQYLELSAYNVLSNFEVNMED